MQVGYSRPLGEMAYADRERGDVDREREGGDHLAEPLVHADLRELVLLVLVDVLALDREEAVLLFVGADRGQAVQRLREEGYHRRLRDVLEPHDLALRLLVVPQNEDRVDHQPDDRHEHVDARRVDAQDAVCRQVEHRARLGSGRGNYNKR